MAGRTPGGWRREWEENGLLGEDRGTLMARKGDDTLGFVAWRRRSYGPHSPCWIVSIALKPEARGRGHGTEAQRQLVRYLFAHTPANRIEAGTEITNVGEQRALERAGFTREGVLRGALFRQGQWHDCVFYGVLRHEVDLGGEAADATRQAIGYLTLAQRPARPAVPVTAGLPGGAEVAAVVLAEGVFLALADVRVLVDVRGVLDLVLGHGQHDPLAVQPGSVDRREALPGAEQAGLHEDPQRLPGLVVEVHLADLADPVVLGVDRGAVDVLLGVLRGGHGCLPWPHAAQASVLGYVTRYKACGATPRDCGKQPAGSRPG